MVDASCHSQIENLAACSLLAVLRNRARSEIELAIQNCASRLTARGHVSDHPRFWFFENLKVREFPELFTLNRMRFRLFFKFAVQTESRFPGIPKFQFSTGIAICSFSNEK